MKKKLIDLIEHLNAEANRDWRDDRHIELNSCIEDEEDLLIDFSLGKFEKSYYLVRVNYNGWKIQENARIVQSITPLGLNEKKNALKYIDYEQGTKKRN